MTSNYDTGAQPGEMKDKLKEELGNKAREASRQFAEKGKAEAEALSRKAADTLDDVEAVAEAEADELERRGWTDLSAYVREMGEGIGNLSDNLRHKSVDELVRSASDLAARNTGLFVLGSIAIGFGLSRFVKAAPAAHAGDMRRAYADTTGSDMDDMEYGSYSASTTRAPGSAGFDQSASNRYAYPAGENSSDVPGDEYRPYESH